MILPCVRHDLHTYRDDYSCGSGVILSSLSRILTLRASLTKAFFCPLEGWQMCLFHPVPVCVIRFCHPQSDETQKSLMMITVIAAQFVCLHLLYHLQTQAHVLNNLSSADSSWVFSCNYAEQCLWFPWRVSKINIKVSDRRVAYWFKRSQSCSHNVSTFDLWPIFMFFDNTADSGCDCGWT